MFSQLVVRLFNSITSLRFRFLHLQKIFIVELFFYSKELFFNSSVRSYELRRKKVNYEKSFYLTLKSRTKQNALV